MIKQYGPVRLLDIEAEAPQVWDFSGATHVRVDMRASSAAETEMQRRGFLFADRTLRVSVRLDRLPAGLDAMIRLPLADGVPYREDIYRMACGAFADDRRFHVTPEPDAALAAEVLRGWVDALDDVLVCLVRGRPAGFLALRAGEEGSLFVHLAAVEARFRASGAAASLYAGACRLAARRGCRRLEGRVSSRNTAVMNLYAALGASFSGPRDIFLMEVRHDA